VRFDIDASCVLEVTAKDMETGRSESFRVEDTTLLSPAEVTTLTARLREQRAEEEQRRAAATRSRATEKAVTGLTAAAADCEAAWREFQQRKAGFHPGARKLDDATQRALADLSGREQEVEAQVRAATGIVPELARRPGTDADQLAELLAAASELSGLLATLASWNRALVAAAVASKDPLALFRDHHDAGDYAAAAELIHLLPDPLDIPDVRRQLQCLARIGDSDRYAALLAASAPRLRVAVVPPSAPEFGDVVRKALVRIHVTRAGAGRGHSLDGGSGRHRRDREVPAVPGVGHQCLQGRAGPARGGGRRSADQ
jgi:molecular chaperone DnaK